MLAQGTLKPDHSFSRLSPRASGSLTTPTNLWRSFGIQGIDFRGKLFFICYKGYCPSYIPKFFLYAQVCLHQEVLNNQVPTDLFSRIFQFRSHSSTTLKNSQTSGGKAGYMSSYCLCLYDMLPAEPSGATHIHTSKPCSSLVHLASGKLSLGPQFVITFALVLYRNILFYTYFSILAVRQPDSKFLHSKSLHILRDYVSTLSITTDPQRGGK